tara:strand:+ start:2690 stop:4348 length:1659 start_codon:yes stop_codon:yes gene_type:complete
MKKKIKIFICFLCFFLANTSSSNEITKKNFVINDLSKQPLAELGLANDESSPWKNFLEKHSFEEINKFFLNLPIKSPIPVVQDLIFEILISEKNINKSITEENDSVLFNTIISQLFNSGRFSEIERLYSKSSLLEDNQMILTRMIESNFLRNQHTQACKILDENIKEKPTALGKVIIICDIINNRHEEARFGLALLKEQNNPGDIFFIELAYSLMSENNLSDSDYLSKILNDVKELNPVVMTSLQFADISPNFEQVENLNTSGLLFIISNPSVEIDLKIFCAEYLVKQGRIGFQILSEAYQLPMFENKELENSLRLYKTLAPVKARPLLYQSILQDENPDSRYEKIRAFLRISSFENLETSIAFLVKDLVNNQDFIKTEEDIITFTKMYQHTKNFDEAKTLVKKIENVNKKKLYQVLLEISQFLNERTINYPLIEGIISENFIDGEMPDEFEEILLVILTNTDLTSELSQELLSYPKLIDKKSIDFDLKKLLLAEKFSSDKDFFNSLKIFFSIVGNNEINELSVIEKFTILVILKNLELNVQLNQFSARMLL